MPLYIFERETKFQFSTEARQKLANQEKIPAEINSAVLPERRREGSLHYQELKEFLSTRLSPDAMNSAHVEPPGSLQNERIPLSLGTIDFVLECILVLVGPDCYTLGRDRRRPGLRGSVPGIVFPGFRHRRC